MTFQDEARATGAPVMTLKTVCLTNSNTAAVVLHIILYYIVLYYRIAMPRHISYTENVIGNHYNYYFRTRMDDDDDDE